MKPLRRGGKLLVGDSAASIHCIVGSVLFYNKRFPGPDEKYLIIGDGRKMEVRSLGCIGVVMHCDEDAKVTLIDVAFVVRRFFGESKPVLYELQEKS